MITVTVLTEPGGPDTVADIIDAETHAADRTHPRLGSDPAFSIGLD